MTLRDDDWNQLEELLGLDSGDLDDDDIDTLHQLCKKMYRAFKPVPPPRDTPCPKCGTILRVLGMTAICQNPDCGELFMWRGTDDES